ncbi:MAG: hypothetical protein IJ058_07195 [Lachnospiraceae bacterium]|nr:hypothetical protein [Lachnospiraceae bacterium]
MNRFNTNEKANILRKLLKFLPLVMGVIVVIIFLFGVNYVSRSSLEGQMESLQNALSRDVAQCYAVEGTYPPSLNYLYDHYGLTYNEDLFYVDYQYIGSNMYPDITIIPLNGGQK